MKRILTAALALLLALAFLAGCTPAAPVSGSSEDTTTTTTGAVTTTNPPLGGVQLDFGKQVYLWVNADGTAARIDATFPEPYASLDVAGLSPADAVMLILQTAYDNGDIAGNSTITHAPANSYNGFDTTLLDAQVEAAINAFVGTLASSGVSVSVSQVTQASTTMTIPSDLTTAPPTTATVPGTTTTTTTRATTTTTTTTAAPAGDYRAYADTAYNDLISHFWDSANNRIKPTSAGIVGSANGMTWEHATMVFAMDSYWRLTGDATVKAKLAAEWINFIKPMGQAKLTGNFGNAPNIAIDDAGWGAMSYMVYYHASGDTTALTYTKLLVQNVYAHHADGSTAYGLFYDESRTFKCMAMVAIMCAALDYTQTTGDNSLLADTINVYNWIQANMLVNGPITIANGRGPGVPYTYNFNNQLYWMSYHVNDAAWASIGGEYNGPDGATRGTFQVAEAGSVSSLFANMGMSVIGARLYKLTGDTAYRTQAVATVNALMNASFYFRSNVFINDRDAWADGSFAGWWASETLTLPGVSAAARTRLLATADSIMAKARTADGYYRAEWSGGSTWTTATASAQNPTVPEQIMTSSNTANMVIAAALVA